MENERALPSDRWWVPIGVIVALVPVGIVEALVLPPDPFSHLPFAVLGLVLAVLSPVAVHYDRRYLRATVDWEPAGWYYLMILPPLTGVLAVVYLVQRHQQVGVP